MILDKGNFLYNILSEIKSRIYNEIRKLDKSLKFEDINDCSDYKLLLRHIDELEKKKKKSRNEKKPLANAFMLNMTVINRFGGLKSKYSASLLKPASEIMNGIEKSKEQVIAPLYALLTCLIVFVCDELIIGMSRIAFYVSSFLGVYISISTIYWTIMWLTFLLDIKMDGNKSKPRKWFQKVREKFGVKITWKHILAYPVFYGICLYAALHVENLFWKRFVAFGIGMILPSLAVACLKVRRHYDKDAYTYESCIKHFLGFVLMSMSVTITTLILSKLDNEVSGVFIYYNDVTPFKYVIFSFILMCGLILPFAIPYIGFHKIFDLFCTNVKRNKEEYDKGISELKNELQDYCKKNVPIKK